MHSDQQSPKPLTETHKAQIITPNPQPHSHPQPPTPLNQTHPPRLEGLHVMNQNVALIREINELRREIKVGGV